VCNRREAWYIFAIVLKNLPIILLGVALIALVSVSCYTDTRWQDKQNSSGDSALTASATRNDASQYGQHAESSKHSPVWRMLLAWPQGVTTLAVLLTLFFIAWQAILMRQTVTASEETSKRELRAYLTVVIGQAVYQERRDEAAGGDLMFECQPILINTGRTPALKIRFKARSAIMPVPLPGGTSLAENTDEGAGDSMLGPQQNAIMRAVVDGFRPENEVENIKRGVGDRGLYVWGRVTYEDVFGERHFTRFCQHIYWDLKNNIRGHYIPDRNDAD
jgi:hypothetical protein